MNTQESIEYIKKCSKEMPKLVHASNIKKKLKDKKNIQAIEELAIKYAEYLEKLISLSENKIKEKTKLLNDYYDFYDNNAKYNYNKLFKSQGKLRSTILEEFVFFLFKDYVVNLKEKYKTDLLDSGTSKAYTNLYFSPSDLEGFMKEDSIKINEKDQDFAIFKKVNFKVGGNKELKIKVPILAIEVKTYLDKTMLEGVIATAEKLKMGNPYSRFIVVCESYQVDNTVDPSYSQIDQIYVLRKCGSETKHGKNPIIDSNVVSKMVEEATTHMESRWSDVKNKMQKEGIII